MNRIGIRLVKNASFVRNGGDMAFVRQLQEHGQVTFRCVIKIDEEIAILLVTRMITEQKRRTRN